MFTDEQVHIRCEVAEDRAMMAYEAATSDVCRTPGWFTLVNQCHRAHFEALTAYVGREG